MSEINPTALLAQILAHPRVKAYGEARGWWKNYTSTFESDVWSVSGKKWEKKHPCEPYYTGPDLALPSNLHELLGLADAMGDRPCSLQSIGFEHPHMATVYSQPIEDGYGPTRTLAVLAALGRALGIEA